MSRRTTIIILVAIIVIIFGGLLGFYHYLSQKSSNSPYGTNSFSLESLFPFGGNSSSNNNSSTNTSTSSPQVVGTNLSNNPVPILRQISNVPVGGATLFDRQVSTTTFSASSTKPKTIKITETFIRYIDRATGQMYQTLTDNLSTDRISNTTFPKIYNAYFDSTASSTILMTIPNEDADIVDTYYGTLSKTGATTSSSTEVTYALNTTLLSNSVTDAVVSPDKQSVFFLLTTSGNPGIIAQFNGTKQNTVWSSPISDWTASWPSSKYIVITSKPAASVAGASYLLNVSTKSYTRLLGDVNGLTTLASPDLSSVLYSSSNALSGTFSLNLLSTTNQATTTMPITTLPEKCVWSSGSVTLYCAVPDSIPSATYPDDWYKGLVSFSDSIWKINISTGQANRIADLNGISGQPIDAIDLTLDAREDYLMFTNKRDLTLWGLQLPASTATSTTK